MAEHRLSKVQKWILVNCYMVTVLKQREDKILARCRDYNAEKCIDNVQPIEEHQYLYNCKTRNIYGKPVSCPAFEFTQYDIYYYFYKMEFSKRESMLDEKIYFKQTPDSEKIYISISRTLKNLRAKNLILYSNFDSIKTIILTDLGLETAKRLIE